MSHPVAQSGGGSGRLWRVIALLVVLAACGPAQADTVVSLLGNYTINQFSGIHLAPDRVDVHYVVVMGQIPALQALHAADTNNDGVTSQTERRAYLASRLPALTQHLHLIVDGQRLTLRPQSFSTGLPADDAGFSLRYDVHYVATLPRALRHQRDRLVFDNRNYARRRGWNEIVVTAAKGIAVFDTNAADVSLTDALHDNPGKLPPGGPLDERRVHLRFAPGAVPAGQTPINSHRPDVQSAASSSPQGPLAAAWSWVAAHVLFGASPSSGGRIEIAAGNGMFARITRWITDKLAPTHAITPTLAALALLGALMLGAFHALSPGHGKTVVGAYLVGSRGTPRHAAFLGLTVTVTHTAGVFALGLLTLVASRYIVPAQLFPVLSLIAALMVLVIGIALFVERVRAWRAARRQTPPARMATPARTTGQTFHFVAGSNSPHGAMSAPAFGSTGGHAHSHVDANGTVWHRHGGHWHSHAPPGADGQPVTWRRMLALGVSGGLVPCPSAMVLLLALIGMHRTGFGLILVAAFSVGLAGMLTGVGLLFVYARHLFRRRLAGVGGLIRVLPMASAIIIVLIGGFMSFGALRAVWLYGL